MLILEIETPGRWEIMDNEKRGSLEDGWKDFGVTSRDLATGRNFQGFETGVPRYLLETVTSNLHFSDRGCLTDSHSHTARHLYRVATDAT